MVCCVGMKGNKYLIREDEPDTLLQFIGPDANRFEQVDAPANPKQTVDFGLEVEYLYKEFPEFLPARVN